MNDIDLKELTAPFLIMLAGTWMTSTTDMESKPFTIILNFNILRGVIFTPFIEKLETIAEAQTFWTIFDFSDHSTEKRAVLM